MSRIVVGVDGSPGSQAALRFAVEEARLRGARLTAVHAWLPPHLADVPAAVVGELGAEAQRAAEAALGALGDPAEVELEVVEGAAGHVLVERAADAELLVVGARGHGAVAGLLLGSVSTHCARHATCPVVIVPAREPA